MKFNFYSVPLDPLIRRKWIHQISKHQEFDETIAYYPVCSLHFDQSKIQQRGKRTLLVKGALPTIFPKWVRLICSKICIWCVFNLSVYIFSASGGNTVWEFNEDELIQNEHTVQLNIVPVSPNMQDSSVHVPTASTSVEPECIRLPSIMTSKEAPITSVKREPSVSAISKGIGKYVDSIMQLYFFLKFWL